MKLLKKLNFIIVVIVLAIVLSSCNASEYTIEWIVDGVTVETDTVKKGEIPVFDGSLEKPFENGFSYEFKNWSPEVVPATANAQYTAEFEKVTHNMPSSFTFEATKFPYDGNEHTILANNLPEGATIVYTDNVRVEPGSQLAKAVVTYYGRKFEYSANLIVEKLNSVLEIETVQEVVSGEDLDYKLNNDEQVLSYTPIYQPGTYYVRINAPATDHYKESEYYEVKVTVVPDKPLGIEFTSCTSILTGDSVELVAKNVPEGYTCTYENNVATSIGKKHAVCHVFDADKKEVATLKAVWTVDYPKNEDFNTFLDEMLVSYLYDDFSTWNAFFAHPESIGFNHDDYEDASWYIYEPLTEEDAVEALEEIKTLQDEFDVFKSAKLSLNQRVSYDLVEELLAELKEEWEGDLNSGLENITYIDSYGGYVGNLNSTLEDYLLNNEQDVIDTVNYLKSAKVAFPSYVKWAEDKKAAGFGLSNYTINEMVTFIDGILEENEEFYLVDYLLTKIDKCEFLDDTKKASYKEEITNAFTNDYFPALTTLKDGIIACKGAVIKEEDEGYWAKYEDGADRYLEKLRSNIGNENLTIDEYLFYVDKYLKSNCDRIDEIIKEYRAMTAKNQSKFINYIEGVSSFIGIEDPNEMVDYLKHFAKFIVPEFENDVKVNIKYMDEIQAKQTTTQAYYRCSALDEFTEEHITLNPLQLKNDKNECLSTMAHEGYPGHLYAYVFIKDLDYHYISKIFDSTGFAEGWAKYVELKLKQYISETTTNLSTTDKKIMDLAIEYLTCNSYSGYLVYCKVDEMAHYEHSTIAEIDKYVSDLGYSGGLAIYRTVIENPVVYNSYGFGQIYMVDCHTTCQEKLGDLYNEIDFNRELLSKGQFDLWSIVDIRDEYVADMQFLYGK